MTLEINIDLDTNILESVKCVISCFKEHVWQMCSSGSVTLAASHGKSGCPKYPDEKNLAVITKGGGRNGLEALGALSILKEMVEAKVSQGCPVLSSVSAAVCRFTEFSQMNLGPAALSALVLFHYTVFQTLWVGFSIC